MVSFMHALYLANHTGVVQLAGIQCCPVLKEICISSKDGADVIKYAMLYPACNMSVSRVAFFCYWVWLGMQSALCWQGRAKL